MKKAAFFYAANSVFTFVITLIRCLHCPFFFGQNLKCFFNPREINALCVEYNYNNCCKLIYPKYIELVIVNRNFSKKKMLFETKTYHLRNLKRQP